MNLPELTRQAIEEHGATQKPAELEALGRFLASRNRYRALEIGSEHGGTLWWLAQLFDKVVSIDPAPVPIDLPNVSLLQRDSHDPATLALILTWDFDFIFIDGDHSYEGVKLDFDMYSMLLAEDGIVGFHDIVTHPPVLNCEVSRFWAELKDTYNTIDIISPTKSPRTRTCRGLAADQCGIGLVLPHSMDKES